MKYSAYSLHLFWSQLGISHDPEILARALLQRFEVREFISENTLPHLLLSTVILAARLTLRLSHRGLRDSMDLKQASYDERGDHFLEIWEDVVCPVLRDPGNGPWAEKWRGGHITNHESA